MRIDDVICEKLSLGNRFHKVLRNHGFRQSSFSDGDVVYTHPESDVVVAVGDGIAKLGHRGRTTTAIDSTRLDGILTRASIW